MAAPRNYSSVYAVKTCSVLYISPSYEEWGMYQEEHNIFRRAFGKFIEREISPFIEAWEQEGIVPREAWKKMGDSGFLCPWLPEEFGGRGADFL